MKIVQIAPVVESSDYGNEDRGTWTRVLNEDATVYGLGDDGKVYYWGVTKSTRVYHTKKEMEEDEYGAAYHYENEYGWLEYRP